MCSIVVVLGIVQGMDLAYAWGEWGERVCLLMKVEGNPLTTQHAQHRPKLLFDDSLAL